MTPSRCLTDLERVWLAAIMDGEGCITITRVRRQPGTQKWRYYPIILFTNTDERLINRFMELAGQWVTTVTNKRDQGRISDNAKPCTQIDIRYRNVESFLNEIKPFLISKKEQADVVLDFMKVQYAEGKRKKRMVPQYNEFYIQIRLLNHRGTTPLDVEKLRQDVLTPKVRCNIAE